MKRKDFEGKIAKLKPGAKVIIRDAAVLGGTTFITTKTMYVQAVKVFSTTFHPKPEDFIIEGYFVEPSSFGKISNEKVEIWVESSQIEKEPLEEKDMLIQVPFIDFLGINRL